MFFKKLIHDLLMILGALVFITSGLRGVFAAMGVCAAIWGENILRTALGSPPDHSHPAFWTGFFIMIPGMLVGFLGGLPICQLMQAYAKWHKGERDKPDLHAWFQNFSREP